MALRDFGVCPKLFPVLEANAAPDLWLFSPSPLQTRAWASKAPKNAAVAVPKAAPSLSVTLVLVKQAPKESQVAFSHW